MAETGTTQEQERELTAAEAAALARLERESMQPTKDSLLYELYCRKNGMLPNRLPGATFSLTLFVEDGALPTAEQRAWLTAAELRMRAMPHFAALLRPQQPGEEPGEEPGPGDGWAMVRVSGDGMGAWLFILPAVHGGEPVMPEQVHKLLAEQQVRFGIDEARIEAACYEGHSLMLVRIAQGVPPVHGIDGYLVDYFKRETVIEYAMRDDGTIDFKDLGWLQTAHEGELLCEAVPPVPPQAGMSVRGTEMPGRAGRAMVPPGGRGTKLSEDRTALTAALDGVLIFSQQRFNVEPLLIIQGDVDNAVGNLDALGDVLIKGDVRAGYTVKASGNITVQGLVEAAHLEAGGGIQIGMGMNGSGEGSLSAGGDVLSQFFENTTVTAEGSIVCEYIVGCAVTCNDAIYAKSGRAALIGGSVRAQNRIEAGVIGTGSGRNISIILGSSAEFLAEKKELDDKLRTLTDELDTRQKNIDYLSGGERELSYSEQAALEDMKGGLLLQRRLVAAAERQLWQLTKDEGDYSHCRLIAGTLNPPAEIYIGTAPLTVREVMENVELYYSEEGVAVKPPARERDARARGW